MKPKDIEIRLTRLESIVATHLEHSGFIQTDLAWLKKAFWIQAGGVLTFMGSLIVGILIFLLHR